MRQPSVGEHAGLLHRTLSPASYQDRFSHGQRESFTSACGFAQSSPHSVISQHLDSGRNLSEFVPFPGACMVGQSRVPAS